MIAIRPTETGQAPIGNWRRRLAVAVMVHIVNIDRNRLYPA
jgi:hypothetical protein